jgi:putative NIF3 family GTP cyclohydrolase 1 type 2
MTIQEIYELAVKMGIQADPRSEAAVKKVLKQLAEEYTGLSEKKKRFFDTEVLHNPYSDSRILYGNPKKVVKKVLAGIDASLGEVLLVDRLNQKGAGIDALISHHPSGHALASLHDVMDLQVDVYASIGVPENVSYGLMAERQSAVMRRFRPINHNQTVDGARLLDIPLIAMHTVWDNLGDHFMKQYIQKRQFATVGGIFDYLLELPEFVESTKGKAGPHIASGSAKSRPGKVAVFFTGGTNPSKEMYIEWAKAGIGTIIDMHMPEEALKEMKKMHVNVIDTGHMASDSIGANIFFDALEAKGVEVIPCSGFIRVKRGGKK